jgi:UDP-2,4-diacetamido-2,4,6-trideoxy-beta-L-altropyranose hydrolase
MKIIFRTDASLEIGTGHVIRCLTLAGSLRHLGWQCKFICREHQGNLVDHIRNCGYEVGVLPIADYDLVVKQTTYEKQSRYSKWLGSDWRSDAAQTKICIGSEIVDWLIVDHYAIDIQWESELREVCHRLMVIDDLANRKHDCDILLDQNLGRIKFDYAQLVSENCLILLGPHYALLRPEFSQFRKCSLKRRTTPKMEHLLIGMGGVDQSNTTEHILEILKSCKLPSELRITVVMGIHAPWLNRVQLCATKMPYLTEVKVNLTNMAKLMAISDLAIGAAGSASWERCCLGLPSLIKINADNQLPIANALQKVGAAKIFTESEEVSALSTVMTKLVDNMQALSDLSRISSKITDGYGARRVSEYLVRMKN